MRGAALESKGTALALYVKALDLRFVLPLLDYFGCGADPASARPPPAVTRHGVLPSTPLVDDAQDGVRCDRRDWKGDLQVRDDDELDPGGIELEAGFLALFRESAEARAKQSAAAGAARPRRSGRYPRPRRSPASFAAPRWAMTSTRQGQSWSLTATREQPQRRRWQTGEAPEAPEAPTRSQRACSARRPPSARTTRWGGRSHLVRAGTRARATRAGVQAAVRARAAAVGALRATRQRRPGLRRLGREKGA